MKKGKKHLFAIMAGIMTISSIAGAFAACGGRVDNSDSSFNESVDEKRTQIYVNCYNGGFGAGWLSSVKERYEKLHENDEWEEGKKGVQIMVNPEKQSILEKSATVLSGRDEVYFSEWAYYYSLKNQGLLGDITDAVSTVSEYDGKTVESKLSQVQQEYYGIKENGETHYYALPHYTSNAGIVYNVDLFDKEGYYFIDEPVGDMLEDKFIYQSTDKKSKGPDGIYDTDDDGLPATYDEFWDLCEYIAQSGNTPITWTGAYNAYYLQWLYQALIADYDGLEQMTLNYSFDGTAKDLGKIINGEFVEDAEDTVITDENAYELSRSASRYYALQFMEKLITTDKYHGKLVANGGYSHLNAQEDFLWAGHDGGTTKPIGMLIEGNWWENEAKATFNTMVQKKGEAYSQMKRNFAWMPLPKANAEKLEESRNSNSSSTLCDFIYSICFMKANVAEWKKPLVVDFIQFCNSDESLVEYSQMTNSTKALNYEMNEEQLSKMSTFGRSSYKFKSKFDTVYTFSSNPLYLNNQSYFGSYTLYYSDLGAKGTKQWVSTALNSGISGKDYFSGMYEYFKKNWIK